MNYTQPMQPQYLFYQQYELARRDELAGILLALFLGSFGIHHFYLRRTGMGILYLCFCWTAIPGFLGVIECFFMPRRVRAFNAVQAAVIAASLGIAVPGWDSYQPGVLPACPACGRTNAAGSLYCAGCGNTL